MGLLRWKGWRLTREHTRLRTHSRSNREPNKRRGRTIGQMVDRRNVLTFSLLLLVATGLCPMPAAAQGLASASAEHGGSSWLNASQQAEIDGLFARPPASPGYAVAIIKDGDFAFSRGYGLANLDDGIPITPETSSMTTR